MSAAPAGPEPDSPLSTGAGGADLAEQRLVRAIRELRPPASGSDGSRERGPAHLGQAVRPGSGLTVARCLSLFDAQLASRHLDAAARWLRARGAGYYTIGSSGHEGNAGVAAALRLTDPALLHYRSGAFYLVRARPGEPAAQRRRRRPAGSRGGGRRADRGRPAQGLRAPRAARDPADLHDCLAPAAGRGLAFAIGRAAKLGVPTYGPRTRRGLQLRRRVAEPLHGDRRAQRRVLGRLPGPPGADAAGLRGQRHRHQRPTPEGWIEATPRPAGLRYFTADGCDLADTYDTARGRRYVRRARGPGVPAPAHGPARGPRRLRRGVRLPHARPRSPRTPTATRCCARRGCWSRPAHLAAAEVLDRYEARRGCCLAGEAGRRAAPVQPRPR